jgi:Bacteriophage HK97-gp10, putative tail-component
MANRLDLNLAAWRDELAAEPAALGAASAPIVNGTAQAAAAALASAYPTGPTGNLRAGVRVIEQQTGDPAVVETSVVSSAPHAHLYEYGTRYARSRPTFYPITNRYAAAAERELNSIVASRGYAVSGTAGD